jgi:hypothetical protein
VLYLKLREMRGVQERGGDRKSQIIVANPICEDMSFAVTSTQKDLLRLPSPESQTRV